jgi:hypothetical protein
MNLFKNELFNPTVLCGVQPRSATSYREPLFAPRYGRRRPVSPVVPDAAIDGAVLAFEAHAIERIGDELVLREFDQAA